ncbi:mediator of RNA polymerase II transcription subunit 15a isoform X2 [Gossypium raimondii]|uniref:mediator of RNA polymerase II transcription subunit 15a isoform X2 n=1 Tax=Gossypium raimondii TaxID=29730 RepID=UPI00227BE388|nr:mediator of RNA polymerase II transcription subunit 15a isoform X2 [Gossypium raimondii]
MDTNNWRSTPPSGEPTTDTGDWRTQLQPDSRQRIINKIMETFMRHLPFSGQDGLNELRKIAVRFEEKIFTAATSQSDYLKRISLKMLTVEIKSQNTVPNTRDNSIPPDPGSQGMQNQVHSQGQSIPISLQCNQSQAQLLPQSVPNNMASAGVQSSAGLQSGMPAVSGLTQNPVPNVVGQNTNMQNMSGISQNSLGQGMSSNMFANQQRQMPRQQVLPQQQQQQQQQQLYHQQLQNQLIKQKLQQGNLQPSLMQSHMQQQQNLLPPTQLQSSQQSGMQTSSVIQQSSMQSTPLPGLQHNQQSSLQQSSQSMLQQHQQFRQQQQAQQAASSGIHQQQTPMTQQSMMPQQQHQHQQPHIMGQQTNAANSQQNQLIGQQNSIADMQQQRLLGQANNLPNLQQQQQQQQQLMAQKNNMSNIHQQQLGPQSNSSGLQQQQQPHLIGAQSGNSSMQANQQSLHMLPQPKVQLQTQQSSPNLLPPTQVQTSQQPQQQQQQQLMSQMQTQSTLQQQLGLPQQHNMPQRLQASGQVSSSLLQSQNLTEQQKQLYQSQRAVPETSSTSLDSTAQTGLANGGDWLEEVYQKILTLKETYLPELNEMYQKIATKLQQHDSNPAQPKSEQLEKLKIFKTMLERIISFLTVSRANITPPFKEKLSSYEKQIINFINSNRPRKPVSVQQQGQLPPPHMHSMQQQQQSQISQTQSHDNQMNPQLQSMNLQGSVPTMQPNNMTSMQHNSLSPGVSTAQQTMLNSLQPGSSLDSGQGNALGPVQQVAPGPLQQNPVSTSQQTNFNSNSLSSQSGLSVLPQNINPLQSNSNMLQHQHMKQQQEQQMLQSQKYKQQFQRQMQHQHIQQKQQLLQQQQQQQQQRQQQQQQQAKQQLSTHQMSQLHQMNDVNDMRQGMGVKPGVFQHLPAGQRQSYTHQQLKPGAQFPVSSPQLLQAASPQIPQYSSPQVDQQNLPSISKTGTPLQSANSPFVVPSPSTPLAPSPMPGESEKPVLGTSLPNVANLGHQQGTGVQTGSQSLAIGTPGISASPLLAEFSGADGTHANALTAVSSKSNVTEQPLERLIKAVKSISPTALGASVSDIGSVVSMTDRIAGSAPGNGSRAAVGEDLVAMTKCRLQAKNFISQDGMSGTKKIRRYTSAMPLNVVSSAGSLNDSFKQLTGSETSELESTATSSVKRPRIEANHALLEEIREINQRLIDTVVDISDEDVDPGAAAATAEGGEGTIVKCSFSAVALSANLKSQYMSAQMSPIQPLHLLVPTNYPNCSPILLDKFPVEVSKENEDLSVKAKSRFSISLRTLSQPMSLGEIARTWDVCARAVISDHAKLSGGGSFSSKYGTWENCLSAA